MLGIVPTTHFSVILAGGYSFLTSAFHPPHLVAGCWHDSISCYWMGEAPVLLLVGPTSDSPPGQVGMLEQGFCPAGHCRKASRLVLNLVASVVIDEFLGSSSCWTLLLWDCVCFPGENTQFWLDACEVGLGSLSYLLVNSRDICSHCWMSPWKASGTVLRKYVTLLGLQQWSATNCVAQTTEFCLNVLELWVVKSRCQQGWYPPRSLSLAGR